MHLAQMAAKWQAHPSRANQTITLVRGVEHMWPECHVPLNACVSRFWHKQKKRIEPIVLVTTDLALSASWMVRHYEERPEIEQDYEQMKSGGWQLTKLSSTRSSESVFYVLTVVLSYSLYHLPFNHRCPLLGVFSCGKCSTLGLFPPPSDPNIIGSLSIL